MATEKKKHRRALEEKEKSGLELGDSRGRGGPYEEREAAGRVWYFVFDFIYFVMHTMCRKVGG